MLLQHLESFSVIVRHGSIRHAAKVLNVSQPAVSKQIKLLEERYGVELLHRTNKGVHPTVAGSELYAWAQKILKNVADAGEAMNAFQSDNVTTVTVGATTTLGTYCLPCSIVLYHNRCKHTRVRSVVGNYQFVSEQLESGKFNVALIEGHARSSGEFQRELIFRDEMVAVEGGSVEVGALPKLSGLPGIPLIMREPGSGIRSALETCLKGAGLRLEDLNVVAELSSLEAIKSAVVAGYGIAFLPRTAVRKELRQKSLRTVSLTEKIHIPYNAVWNSEAITSAEAGVLKFLLSPERGFCSEPLQLAGVR